MICTTLYPECRPQINHTLSNLPSRTHPKSSWAVQDKIVKKRQSLSGIPQKSPKICGRIPRDSETNKTFFLWKMFNFLITWRSLAQTWQQGHLGGKIFSPNVHWWANQACSWLLRTLNILHYLNLSMFLRTIILAIIWYTPNMIVPHKWTQIWWLGLPN